jgi:uncharacterized protein YndB with AHSA1/START domain
MDDHDLGRLEVDGDRCVLTFTRRLAHPPDKVWRAVTEPAHMEVWFPHEMVGDRRAGAAVRFVTAGDDGFDGEVLAFEAPSVMELRWGEDRLRIELAPDGDGTVLTLTDTFTELGKAARDAAGWHECLDRLASDLDGTPPAPWGAPWAALNARYVAALGPAASVIGPPEGWEPGS